MLTQMFKRNIDNWSHHCTKTYRVSKKNIIAVKQLVTNMKCIPTINEEINSN